MFHTLYKISIILIVPLIFVLFEYFYSKQKKINCNKLEVFCKWFTFWAIGISAVTAGFMQIFNPAYTANLLNVNMSDFVVIQELGFANLSMGSLAVLSLKQKNFRLPAAIVYGAYILLCAAIHVTRIKEISYGETVSLVADVWIMIISILTIVTIMKERFFSRKANLGL